MHPRFLTCLAVLLACAFSATDAQAQRTGSIYAIGRGPVGIIADKTARRPGDLVTIVINENQDFSNQAQTNHQKVSSLDYELENFDIAPNAFNVLPSLGGSRDQQFNGQANVINSNSFEARVTAMVMDVLPNGNMVISGRREIRIDSQVRLIEFSGVVRRFDVSQTNTVDSELVADARVAYIGQGPTTETTERRGVHAGATSFLDWVWPF
jgi:flagellar L-ring protein precursor FlgH